MNRHHAALFALALLATNAVACSSDRPVADDGDPGPTITLPIPGAAGGPKVSGPVRIFASTELAAIGVRLGTAFMAQNPDAEVAFKAEPPRESMLRFIAREDADVFITDLKSIAFLRAYINDLPGTRGFAREVLVMVVPDGNPAGVNRVSDLGDPPPPAAVCTPPIMRLASATPIDEVKVPVNLESSATCGAETVDAVIAGDLGAALVPGSAAGFIRANKTDRVRIPLAGNLFIPYGLVVLSNREAATGFANFVASARGRNVLTESGYDP